MPGFQNLTTVARRLRVHLQQHHGPNDPALDRGIPLRRWAAPSSSGLSSQAPQLVPGQADTLVSVPEIFQESLRRLEQIRFGSTSFAREVASTNPTATDFYNDYRRDAAYFPPWLIDDGNPINLADHALRARIDSVVQTAQREAQRRGHRRGSVPYNDLVLTRLLQSLRQAQSAGGFGLSYVFSAGNRHRRRNAIEAFAAHQGDCNAFSFLFYALARRAGLNPRFISIPGERQSYTGPFRAIYHVGVAVEVRPGALRPCDPSRGVRVDEGRYQWYPLTNLEMLASFLRDVGLYNVSRPAEQEQILLQAYRLAPNSFDIAHDVSWFYRNIRHSPRRAAPYVRRAQQINPSMQPIWESVQRQRAGRPK